jgi:hypothetical protein
MERIPSSKLNGLLQPEWVSEVDGQGRLVRRWPAPVDVWVQGIEGEELLVPWTFGLGHEEEPLEILLAIRPNGKFRVSDARELAAPEWTDCRFTQNEADTRSCLEVRDAGDGTVRHLQYATPCT